jgi:NADH-quinone oxidoreductase subunit H
LWWAIGALGIFGIVLGGWASNSHYSLLGALRSAAQLVSYETAAGLAIVGALLLAGTLSIRAILCRRRRPGPVVHFCRAIGIFYLSVVARSRKPIARHSICRKRNRNLWPDT